MLCYLGAIQVFHDHFRGKEKSQQGHKYDYDCFILLAFWGREGVKLRSKYDSEILEQHNN